jgi:hypothetical protein
VVVVGPLSDDVVGVADPDPHPERTKLRPRTTASIETSRMEPIMGYPRRGVILVDTDAGDSRAGEARHGSHFCGEETAT